MYYVCLYGEKDKGEGYPTFEEAFAHGDPYRFFGWDYVIFHDDTIIAVCHDYSYWLNR